GFPREVGIISGRIPREKDLEGPAGAHLVSAVVIALDIGHLPRNQRNAVTAERAVNKRTLPLVRGLQHVIADAAEGKTNSPHRLRRGPEEGGCEGTVCVVAAPVLGGRPRLRRIRDQRL